MEQREIKVRRFWARFAFWRPFSFSLACYAHFRFVCLSFLLLLSFLLPVLLLFLFNSFLFYRGGGHAPVSPLFISISIPSSSSVLFSSSAVYFSGEYSAGRPSLSASPQRTSPHPQLSSSPVARGRFEQRPRRGFPAVVALPHRPRAVFHSACLVTSVSVKRNTV